MVKGQAETGSGGSPTITPPDESYVIKGESMDSNSSTAPASAEAPKPPRRGLRRTTRDLVLASIGVVGVLGDEAQALYRRSVERGGGTVKKVKERLKPARGPRRLPARLAGRQTRRSHGAVDEIEAALARLNLPNAADMDLLTQQVAELEAKIDQCTDN